MSYILDALRRAEADRERGAVPGLHAQTMATVAASPDRSAVGGSRWMLPVFVALAAAVALLGWRPWVVDPPAPAAVAPVGSAPAPASPPTAVPGPAVLQAPPPLRPVEAPARRAPVPLTLATAAKKHPAAAASGADVAPAPAGAAASAAKVYSLAELPPDVRQQLPQIAIGGSIYSTSPASRFVIVNGQLFHEGDAVAPGLVLEQIRLKSLVLAFRGYRYGITF